MSCGMWDLSSGPEIKLAPPALEVWNLNHQTTREVLNRNSLSSSEIGLDSLIMPASFSAVFEKITIRLWI